MDAKKGDSHYWARRSSYKVEPSPDNSLMTPEEVVTGKLANEI
jgi:hypothetical protein